jgi:hypothetical protein
MALIQEVIDALDGFTDDDDIGSFLDNVLLRLKKRTVSKLDKKLKSTIKDYLDMKATEPQLSKAYLDYDEATEVEVAEEPKVVEEPIVIDEP